MIYNLREPKEEFTVEYKGYTITSIDENIIAVDNIRDFNLVHIFECGQCFRWYKQKDGSYTGVAKGKVVNILYKMKMGNDENKVEQGYNCEVHYCENENQEKNNKENKSQEGTLYIKNSNMDDFISIWYDYLDLGRDYDKIKQILSAKDNIMKTAVEFGYGIRLLKQDFYEALISFIISANNRIPMIMKAVAAISDRFGEKILFEDKIYYTFPEISKLAMADMEEILECKTGFRCKYISSTSKLLNEDVVVPPELCELSTLDAREKLKQLPGVGNKVADCSLLYSGIKYDVFPTDVWVKRVMEELYFKREASLKEIQDFAAGHFGALAGFAQQYLFYYARENKIGASK